MTTDPLQAAFLFGNLNEDGQLEQEEWSVELRQNSTAILSVLSRSMDTGTDLKSDFPAGASSSSTGTGGAGLSKFRTEHAPDAQDFADINEVAADDATGDDSNGGGFTIAPSVKLEPLRPLQLKSMVAAAEVEQKQQPDVETVFPAFRPGKILKFSELFVTARRKTPAGVTLPGQRAAKKHRMEAMNKVLSQTALPSFDQRFLFLSEMPLPKSLPKSDLYTKMKSREIPEEFLPPTFAASKESLPMLDENAPAKESPVVDEPEFHPVNTMEWEESILWDEPQEKQENGSRQDLASPTSKSSCVRRPMLFVTCFPPSSRTNDIHGPADRSSGLEDHCQARTLRHSEL